MRKLLAVIMAVICAFAMCACGQKQEEPEGGETGMSNPFTEVASADELAQATEISLDAPEGAADVVYSYCDGEGEYGEFAQVVFTLDGKRYTYRCMDAEDLTSLATSEDDGDEFGEAMEDFNNAINIGTEFSGMYYDWDCAGTTLVCDRNAVCAAYKKGPGFIMWLDAAPGFLYSLSVDDGATMELLMNTAEACFVPMQGDV